MAAGDDVRQTEKLFRASEERAARLSSEALRFISTAEYVAGRLEADPQLEWSPAVIGLCKAVEAAHSISGRGQGLHVRTMLDRVVGV
jgi:hypothetical protein